MYDKRLKQLEHYVGQYMDRWDGSGVVQITYKDEVLFEASRGYACLEFGIPNQANTRFALASVSKQFTAFAIMLLQDKCLLNLDRPANDYLPTDMQLAGTVTLHQLLSHTSGLYQFNHFQSDFFGEGNRGFYDKKNYFSKYFTHPPAPGGSQRYEYNNANYHVLAWIIEEVTGESYTDFLTREIFSPLDMLQTTVDDGETILPNKAFGYIRNRSELTRTLYYNEKFSIGAGGIISNCADLQKWHACLRERRLLSPDGYRRFFRENLQSYCYGLERQVDGEGNISYWHGGDHLGIATYMQSFLEEDLSIIILCNSDGVNQYKLGRAISDIIHGRTPEESVQPEEQSLSLAELQTYCGVYLPGKIEVTCEKEKLYFTRFAGSLHLELYPVGNGQFARRYYDQVQPYTLSMDEHGVPHFFGFAKMGS